MKQEDETLDKAAGIMREWKQTLPERLWLTLMVFLLITVIPCITTLTCTYVN